MTSSLCRSHTFLLTPFSMSLAIKLFKRTFSGEERNHWKPRRWCSYTCQKQYNLPPSLPKPFLAWSQLRLFSYHSQNKRGLFYSLFQSLYPTYSDCRPKSFLPFLVPSSPLTFIFGDFNWHHSSWDSHSPEDQLGKDLYDWLLSSDLLPLYNPDHYTLPTPRH